MDKQPVILFDGVCNLCNASVNFVIDRDPESVFRFGALQSDEGKAVLSEAGVQGDFLDSIVLVEDGEVYVASEAALRIARKMPAPWPLLYALRIIPRTLRDGIYNWIARNRYRWFGKQESCRMPTPELKEKFL